MRLIIKIVAVALLVLTTVRVFADFGSAVFVDDNYMIVDVGYKRQLIGEGIELYATHDDVYLALADLVALLELNIAVNNNDAKGVAGDGVTDFQLINTNEATWQVSYDNKVESLATGDILTHDDRIYINQRLALAWFGAGMELDFSESTLSLSLTKPAPIEARIARQNRSSPSQNYLEESKLPLFQQPYAWGEVPSLDFRMGYIATRYEDKNIKANRASYYSGRTIGDLLAMSTETFFSGNRDDGLKAVSVRMDRYDDSRNLLGPLRLSQVSLGDITHPSVGGISSTYGRGLLIGNDINQGGVAEIFEM
ncbi:MAG: hypothetical protein U5M23_06710 [Marinagarivorans sp.]|nr:hypothetical protein [Marinagarivorans sp.]